CRRSTECVEGIHFSTERSKRSDHLKSQARKGQLIPRRNPKSNRVVKLVILPLTAQNDGLLKYITREQNRTRVAGVEDLDGYLRGSLLSVKTSIFE
ncbi:hypothetical protein L9F63_021076, partial [Diploptera punctata]